MRFIGTELTMLFFNNDSAARRICPTSLLLLDHSTTFSHPETRIRTLSLFRDLFYEVTLYLLNPFLTQTISVVLSFSSEMRFGRQIGNHLQDWVSSAHVRLGESRQGQRQGLIRGTFSDSETGWMQN